uniref:NADH dehydrogenase subunit 3 n=1 Tax=Neoseiulus californicus TaxID=84382 RepID=UPI0022DCDE74|nr:NADH dehydrogenase subunit 3 [Neoseiulus californicus]UZU69616.1 NADH dehydrogenase subunit 3 [Neoseiulus californicus]WJN56896.1 NADH dehydrogenase subunit 3 [Neoseiulus californicus]WKV28866.1 NADH dehydrogenase subunit 3 [Neoseiulus californicus]
MMMKMIMLTLISIFLYLISMFSLKSNKNKEKLISFECGFNPFNMPQASFSLQFFKILMIFMLFDMELIVILPLTLFKTQNYSLLFTLLILFILILGLIFEWKEGNLEWLK